ncbi:MAG: siroheme synthase [Rhodospirillaceae bacterium]|nr:siroheme synthase [Rhodospirillaceae bacterium]MBT6828805.1 siroheme synthase [Rhodospirillaceae bacterium]
MRHYPAFLDIEGRPCLVVGGGAAALAKVRLLGRAGAAVTAVAPSFDDDIRALGKGGGVTLVQRAFRDDDVQGHALVHAASADAALDEAVACAAGAENIPVNVVDRPALSSFVMPAIVDRGAIVVGISSGGASPVLARRVRAEIEILLPHGLGALAQFAHKFRSAVRATFADFETRLRFWENFFDGPLAEAVLQGGEMQARSEMLALINRAQLPPAGELTVLEVDPLEADLLTLRDVRRIARADLLIHGGAIVPAILDHARRDAVRIELAPGGTKIKIVTTAHLRAGKRIVQLMARGQTAHAALSAV